MCTRRSDRGQPQTRQGDTKPRAHPRPPSLRRPAPRRWFYLNHSIHPSAAKATADAEISQDRCTASQDKSLAPEPEPRQSPISNGFGVKNCSSRHILGSLYSQYQRCYCHCRRCYLSRVKGAGGVISGRFSHRGKILRGRPTEKRSIVKNASNTFNRSPNFVDLSRQKS